MLLARIRRPKLKMLSPALKDRAMKEFPNRHFEPQGEISLFIALNTYTNSVVAEIMGK